MSLENLGVNGFEGEELASCCSVVDFDCGWSSSAVMQGGPLLCFLVLDPGWAEVVLGV